MCLDLNAAPALTLGNEKYRKKTRWHFDLGTRALWPQWKNLFSTQGLKEDAIAGLTVSCIAVPLSLAIALASHVEPAIGLITAILAGVVCALFGGTPLAVSGPAAAMAVLIAANVEQFGLSGLMIMGALSGLLQLMIGVFGLGKLVRFIPLPVIVGFTAGIGAIILIGQLPRALGLPAPDQAHVVAVIQHLTDLIHKTDFKSLSLAATTIVLCKVLPRISVKIPAPLVAVVLPSLAANLFGFDVAVIGAIPRELPQFHFPSLSVDHWLPLVTGAVVICVLASLETLLSSTVVDRMAKGDRHDPDQELIGQGIGNLVVSFFGGIPVTGVIARSALNVRSGARTRRAAIFHSLALLSIMFVFAPVIGRIPIAVLSGLLISVAMGMLHPAEVIQLWKASKAETLVGIITFFTIVFVDLIAGVQAGVAAAFVITVFRMGQVKIINAPTQKTPIRRISVSGGLTFLSSAKFEDLRESLYDKQGQQNWVVDLSQVTGMDASGALLLIDLAAEAKSRKVNLLLKGLAVHIQKELLVFDTARITIGLHVATEAQIKERMNSYLPHQRLREGVASFKAGEANRLELAFESLIHDQRPHTLFVTCSDSRIVPNLITSTEPGELFILRNVGNLIPPFGSDKTPAEGAAIEYAVKVLGVQEIILCGHYGCGAMAALLQGVDAGEFPSLAQWLDQANPFNTVQREGLTPKDLCELNVLAQLRHLRTYPEICSLVERKKLNVRGWIYDLGKSEILQWEERETSFRPVNENNESLSQAIA